jgi:molybdopterin-binding protein
MSAYDPKRIFGGPLLNSPIVCAIQVRAGVSVHEVSPDHGFRSAAARKTPRPDRACRSRIISVGTFELIGRADFQKGATTAAHVRIDLRGQIITASITNESVDELKLEKGKTAYAISKATSVMVGVD